MNPRAYQTSRPKRGSGILFWLFAALVAAAPVYYFFGPSLGAPDAEVGIATGSAIFEDAMDRVEVMLGKPPKQYAKRSAEAQTQAPLLAESVVFRGTTESLPVLTVRPKKGHGGCLAGCEASAGGFYDMKN